MDRPPASAARFRRSSREGRKSGARVLLAALYCVAVSCAAAQRTAPEYALKAALLFNISQFVEWPASALADGTNAPFVIGILGKDPFGEFLEEVVKGERAHGKSIEVRRFEGIKEALTVHILFVCKSEEARIQRILPRVEGQPVLIVTESDNPAGMIALVREGDKIRLRINLDAARSAGLTISTKLLRVADSVRNEKQF